MNYVLALKCSIRNFYLKYLNTVFKMLKQLVDQLEMLIVVLDHE